MSIKIDWNPIRIQLITLRLHIPRSENSERIDKILQKIHFVIVVEVNANKDL